MFLRVGVLGCYLERNLKKMDRFGGRKEGLIKSELTRLSTGGEMGHGTAEIQLS
jgi:hypothetical protein